MLSVSMIFSPFLLSLSMWALALLALLERADDLFIRHPGKTLDDWSTWFIAFKLSLRRLWEKPVYLLFTLLLLVPALSYFWSADSVYWAERTRVRIPFFVLPWAFANLPGLSEGQYRFVLNVLVGVLAAVCIGVGINFALHADEILFGLSEGRPIPVPRHHIRFNLMLATGIIAGGWLWAEYLPDRPNWLRRTLGVLVILLFVFIHILSVRSGLAALYAALVFTVVRYIWRSRQWLTGLTALVLLIALPLLALRTVPSLQQRISYMQYDWQHYRANEGESYSDSERWISLKTGWMMWLDKPLLGVGAGDLPRETERLIAQYFPKYLETPKLPHNQFLYILAGTGLLGLLLSLVAFYAPLCYDRYRRYYLFMAFQVMVFVSFLVEYTIETAMGVAWYLFYTLWFMRMAEERV